MAKMAFCEDHRTTAVSRQVHLFRHRKQFKDQGFITPTIIIVLLGAGKDPAVTQSEDVHHHIADHEHRGCAITQRVAGVMPIEIVDGECLVWH